MTDLKQQLDELFELRNKAAQAIVDIQAKHGQSADDVVWEIRQDMLDLDEQIDELTDRVCDEMGLTEADSPY